MLPFLPSESSTTAHWKRSSHKLISDRTPGGGLKVPPSWENCAGPPSVWDLHVEEIKVPEQMRLQSESTEIARYMLLSYLVLSSIFHQKVDFFLIRKMLSDGLFSQKVNFFPVEYLEHCNVMPL